MLFCLPAFGIETGHMTLRKHWRVDDRGTAGAPVAVANAVNDALRVLGARPITEVPIGPEAVLGALGKG